MRPKYPYDAKPLATHTGPGDYNPEKAKMSKSYTMGFKPKDPNDHQQPGPGQYETNDYYAKIKGCGLERNKRDTSVDHKSVVSPGPAGMVQVAKNADKNAGPKFGFGTEARDKGYIQRSKSQKAGPGPGDYNHKECTGPEGPGYTMGGRRADVRVLPGKYGRGPGSYNSNLNTVKRNGTASSFPHSQKGKVPDIYGHTPAPNSYDPNALYTKNK